MDNIRIFIDFGSTFTKAVAFDLDKEEMAARVQVPSTVDTDISVGLQEAFDKLSETMTVDESNIKQTIACSSAAGGLRMICMGLVPEYTTEAGRLAALGAGAKIVGTYSYEISKHEAKEIAEIAPDIILLTGGTDGGNKKTICHNAGRLSEIEYGIKNIIVAGNKSACDDIEEIFEGSRKNIIYTKNVMPEFGKLDLDPVNKKIRELFINRITDAKGISKVKEMISDVSMPTPSAVLEAAKIIADGSGQERGLGELLLVDVGGATTDVYSIAKGTPAKEGVTVTGLPEPYAKRTVEGDLGLFHNLDTLSDIAVTSSRMAEAEKNDFESKIIKLREMYCIPEGNDQKQCQLLLSHLAVKTAVERHAGSTKLVVTHNGDFWVQSGKDLTQVKTVIGAGGPIAFSSDPHHVLEGAVFKPDTPNILKPKMPAFYLDQRYILFAVGLLAQTDPEKALRIIMKYLVKI
ncbi:MAG: glutamate mutase L [Spirochaetes bacterium]|nr:glutamate mutase L [Spirochaetota bacterium]